MKYTKREKERRRLIDFYFWLVKRGNIKFNGTPSKMNVVDEYLTPNSKMKKYKPKPKTQRSNNANTVLNEVGGAVEKELHFETQWDAIIWMREELNKKGLLLNPIHKDFNDKIWLRYFKTNE